MGIFVKSKKKHFDIDEVYLVLQCRTYCKLITQWNALLLASDLFL